MVASPKFSLMISNPRNPIVQISFGKILSRLPREVQLSAIGLLIFRIFRKYDSPSFILLAFIPPTSQSAYLALRALNLELARIPDTTSVPAVSQMRYQFWRDAINSAFPNADTMNRNASLLAASPKKEPVTILLSHALTDLSLRTESNITLSKSWLLRLVSAREKYSDGRPYTSLDSLERYAEDTYSTLLYLTLQSLPLTSLPADHIASHIGKAMGITAILRGIPLLAFPAPANHHSQSSRGLSPELDMARQAAGQGTVSLPLDVMARVGVKDEDVLRMGAEAPGLRDAVFEVATRASDHLITARSMLKSLQSGEGEGHEFEHGAEEEFQRSATPNSTPAPHSQKSDLERAFGVFMPAVSTSLWLDKLQKYDFDVFREELRRREWKLPWKAWLAYRRRMF